MLLGLLRVSFLSLSLTALSCSGASQCPSGFLGDPAAAPELVPAALDRDAGRLVTLTDGDPVDLVRPIQGGHVIFVGAFVKNVDSCGGSLRGELRRDQGGAPGGILVSDERSSELVPVASLPGSTPPAGAGWGGPMATINDVPNVPACPNVLSDELLDVPGWLQLTFTARDGRQAVGRVRVVPRCRQTDDLSQQACRCECLKDYTIDRCAMR